MTESIKVSENFPISADIISGEAHQRVKIQSGVDGTAEDVSTSNPLPTNSIPATSGGLTMGKKISEATTNATSLKESGGQVYGWIIGNTSSGGRAVKLFNKASAPTVGSDAPNLTIWIPKETTLSYQSPLGILFPTGIAFAFTKGPANLNAEAVASEDIIFDIFYK